MMFPPPQMLTFLTPAAARAWSGPGHVVDGHRSLVVGQQIRRAGVEGHGALGADLRACRSGTLAGVYRARWRPGSPVALVGGLSLDMSKLSMLSLIAV